MNGDIWLGPNAVLAFKREGYNLTDIEVKDFVDAVGYPGLQKLAMKNFKFGIGEIYRGFNVSAQVRPTLAPSYMSRAASASLLLSLQIAHSLLLSFLRNSSELVSLLSEVSAV